MNNYIKILLIIIFFSSCSLLDKKKYNSSYLQEVYFNQYNLNKNYFGMTKEQIVYIFGSPIISDAFNDVYHYYLYHKNGKNIIEKKMLNLYFKDNKVFSYTIK